jgi:hypothetical protein
LSFITSAGQHRARVRCALPGVRADGPRSPGRRGPLIRGTAPTVCLACRASAPPTRPGIDFGRRPRPDEARRPICCRM